MASLILCHPKRAKHPYEITRIHKKIYTIEELCYYLCNHLYLVDSTIMNHQLCSWIDRELELNSLARGLKFYLTRNASIEQFIMEILEKSNIYSERELYQMQATLETLKNQKDVEREKYKGDTLFDSKEYEAAILVYQSILKKEWDTTVKKEFYGHIHASLGSCFGRLFLYDEAVRNYKEAVALTDDDLGIIKAYLYSCKQVYTPQEYTKMLSNNSLYLSIDGKIKEETQEWRKQANLDVSTEDVRSWRQVYRKIDSH
ncbi:tetratricopeptide (TPR) repeat protein [Aequitasia blattaphilus]|uniref:Tetratricopeptide repeat protein n=1 Tax=Aequitasia blattaphilus TaxID=2949332 RepID=A0ABT1ECM3_9FIRM|nr:hypothetical protein [Aequitasia blattaphilus]MCP1103404.1 hypothetical protein [Aequitasia blattaphilus]MCR8616044.1 hypothetical protein [Aequitasia blattaphilus]